MNRIKKLSRSNLENKIVHKSFSLESYAYKTLDLDVRLMLANFLSDNFSSIPSIDWHTVVSRPEFRGHSEFSLRKIFWSTLVRTAATDLGVSRTELSLQQVAQHAQSGLKGLKKTRSVKKVKKRQLDLIDYFESACNINGIC